MRAAVELRPNRADVPRDVPNKARPRRWLGPLLASAALHGLLVAHQFRAKAGPGRAAMALAPVEFLLFEPAEPPSPPPLVAPAKPSLAAMHAANALAKPTSTPRAPPQPVAQRTRTPNTAKPSRNERARPAPLPSNSSTRSTALPTPGAPFALRGMRDQAHALPASAPSPGAAPGPQGPLILSDHGALAGAELEGPRPAVPPAAPNLPARPNEVDDPMRGVVEFADGSFGYTDPSGMFNAYIGKDGSVRFQDSKTLKVKMCVAFVCVGGGGVKQVERGGKAFRSTVGVDFQLVPLGLAGAFGSKIGTNRREAAFLKRTAGVRLAMTGRWQKKQIFKQLNALRSQLDALWKDTSLDDAKRRRIYQELWEECDVGKAGDDEATWESLPKSMHKARTDAAKSARKVIASHYLERAGEPLF